MPISGGVALLDGADVTDALRSCLIPGTLSSGGRTFRCPGVAGSALGAGTHSLTVSLNLTDGSTICDAVTWDVKQNAEP